MIIFVSRLCYQYEQNTQSAYFVLETINSVAFTAFTRLSFRDLLDNQMGRILRLHQNVWKLVCFTR